MCRFCSRFIFTLKCYIFDLYLFLFKVRCTFAFLYRLRKNVLEENDEKNSNHVSGHDDGQKGGIVEICVLCMPKQMKTQEQAPFSWC